MADDLGIDIGLSNPIAYAQLQLRGGWKNLLLTCGVYALAIGILLLATLRYNPLAASSTLSVWATILLVLQTAFFTFLGCASINAAIRTDTASHMIDSHRLMPLSPASAILGYLLGAPCQFLVMAAITFLLGWVCTVGASLPTARWLVAHAVLGMFTLLLWTGLVFFAFAVKGGVRWYFGVLIAAATTRGIILSLLPAVALLTSPLMRHTIYDARDWNTRVNPEYALAMAAQAAISAIFFIAAARRFRRPERPAMGGVLSLTLLATWVAVSCIAIYRWEEIRPVFNRNDLGPVQLIATLAVSVLLALLPLSSSGWMDAEWRRRRLADDPGLSRRPLPPLLTPILATAIILPLTWVSVGRLEVKWDEPLLRTALGIALYLLAIGYLQRMMYRVGARAAVLTTIVVVVTWVGPFAVDIIRFSLSDISTADSFGPISTASPLGLLIALWSPEFRHPINTDFGLIFQAALAGLAALLFYRPRLQAARKASPA